ncbi:hypothetical protein FUA23_16425 [Neolewinella aurantiaca]|uniref:Uncharacterized protein n=1 Tax=Neolewinella aurantiaca TaxID=2602767 RepID=A0A5C7FEW6_9BACT|nr:hypothetical protein [Neolewinella aurantiaca]TXF88066.1 hypothetical protein FUA23_16425 [Neolewinella aurantiaca]
METRIQQYRFSDSKAGIVTAAAVHLMCGTIFYMLSDEPLLSSGRPQLLWAIGLILLVLFRYYSWKNTSMNLLIVAGYIAGLIFEWLTFGIPEAAMTLNMTGYNKGFITTAIVQTLPWLYAGLRVCCTLLLVHVAREGARL